MLKFFSEILTTTPCQNNYTVYFSHGTENLGDASMKNIVMLMILVICTPSYLSNPYLTAKLIEVRSLKSTILGILCIIIMIRYDIYYIHYIMSGFGFPFFFVQKHLRAR